MYRVDIWYVESTGLCNMYSIHVDILYVEGFVQAMQMIKVSFHDRYK